MACYFLYNKEWSWRSRYCNHGASWAREPNFLFIINSYLLKMVSWEWFPDSSDCLTPKLTITTGIPSNSDTMHQKQFKSLFCEQIRRQENSASHDFLKLYVNFIPVLHFITIVGKIQLKCYLSHAGPRMENIWICLIQRIHLTGSYRF